MDQLAHVKSMIIVFVMADCPHCETYKPRFEAIVNSWIQHGQPLYWYQPGVAIPHGVVPVLVLDAASEDPTVADLGDQYTIEGVPATVLLTRRTRPSKHEGVLSDAQLYELMSSAVLANR